MHHLKTLSILLGAAVASLAVPLETRSVPGTFYFFSFGDSYTATGFNIKDTNPSIGNPMGNPRLGTPTVSSTQPGTYTGGINYIGYLATKYNFTTVLSYDFATGGACINDTSPGCNPSNTCFFKQATQLFSPQYTSNSPWKTWNGNNSIFSVFFGINDIFDTLYYSNGSPGNPNTVCQKLVESYMSIVDSLYAQGGRRFLFLAVPPIDRTPYIQSMNTTTITTFRTWVDTFNAALGQTISSWLKSKNDAFVSVYNTFGLMNAVLDHPEDYGFPDATCSNSDGQSCVWWNIFHPGSKFNDIQAKRMQLAMQGLGYDGSAPKTGFYY